MLRQRTLDKKAIVCTGLALISRASVMAIIKTVVDKDTYARLVSKRRAAGLVSISALFLKQCGEPGDKNEAHTIVRRALLRAVKMEEGAEFTLPKLFRPAEWRRFDKAARLRSGRMFKAEVNTKRFEIRPLRLSSDNHQVYVRISDTD